MSAVTWKFITHNFFLHVFVTLIVCLTAAAQSSVPPLASADAAMQSGRFADAAREYEAWLKVYPDAKEVLLALGICYVQLGRQDEAVAMLRRHLKLVPKSAAGRAALGIALLDGAKTTEAKAELETAIQLNPKQADAVEALARVYLIEGRAAEAVSLLRPLAASGANEEIQALLGDALVKAGQPRDAAAMLERQLQTNPRAASRIYSITAWAHLKAGDLARAAEVCERGMRIYPDSEIEAVYLSLPAPFLAERIGARINRLQDAPEVAEMIAVGRVLIDADPSRKTRANEIAQRMLSHAITLAPDSASAHYNYGRALSQGSVERALGEWEKALTLNPGSELRLQILTKIGAARLSLSDVEAAERAFREALEVNRKLPKRNPQAMLEYVRFLQSGSRIEEAERLLNEVLSLNPLSPQAHLERARMMVARGQWDKVIVEGEFVLRNAGEDEELLRSAHVLLARAYLRLNQPEKAQKHRSWLESR
ncbi:MAG TPA: tetratricopeptide repeat protein [Pyrinomonadaceae bacterium]|nr:tetratricopeptide repeat protein [Pyrinomonadaceae bacterium]